MTRRKPQTPGGEPNGGTLRPEPEKLAIGGGKKPAEKVSRASDKVPFSSYLPRDLLREFKVRCVMSDLEMQAGMEQAIREWLARHPA